MIMKESIIIHIRTMEIGENIKRVIKTSIGMKISVIVIDLMIQMILMAEIGHIAETDHIVEIDCETTVEMSIRRKIIDIREGLDIIMKMPIRTGMIGIIRNTNTEMKAIIWVEIDLDKSTLSAMQGKPLTIQNLN